MIDIGPLLMDLKGKWLANSFCKMVLIEDGKYLDFEFSESTLEYLPGLLRQTHTTNEIKITKELLFVDNKTSLVQTKIQNLSKNKRIIHLLLKGETLDKQNKISIVGNNSLLFNLDEEMFFTSQFYSPSISAAVGRG